MFFDPTQYFTSDTPAVKGNLRRLFSQGKLAGTGKLIILPVDQGFEHGPVKSFKMNKEALMPSYHPRLALEGGLSAYAAPLGMIESCADEFAGKIPLILKLNNSHSLVSDLIAQSPTQVFTSSSEDALRLGCSGIGITIYPGSDSFFESVERVAAEIKLAKSLGLFVVIWAYPRGGGIPKEHETSQDVIAYSAHIACLLGANIVKVKIPAENFFKDKINDLDLSQKSDRVKHIVDCCFASSRYVIFSGGQTKSRDDVLDDVKAIAKGGGTGSVIGRNVFQRPRDEALSLLSEMINMLKLHS